MPVPAAISSVLSVAALMLAGSMRSPAGSPYEFVMTSARWWSTMLRTIALRSPTEQFSAPANRMWAPGAVACTASTSRVCSPYQPLGPHRSARLNLGASTSLNWELASGLLGSLIEAYVCASESSVGAAYASTIATVTPEPSGPPFRLYALRNCDGVWPQVAHGGFGGKPLPYGGRVV